MCKFCEEEVYLLNDNSMSITIEEDILILRVYSIKMFSRNLQINYCPMCGKKLGDDEK